MFKMKILSLFLLAHTIAVHGFKYDQDRLNHMNIGPKGQPPKTETVEDQYYWYDDADNDLDAALNKADVSNKIAKNIIIFLADGAGIGTFTAARLSKGYDEGNFERQVMSWDKFPYTGILKTYNTDMQVTDSGAASTAYSTGSKSNQHTIGVDVNVRHRSCEDSLNPEHHTQSVLRDFQLSGRSTGMVTTERVTDASPAGNFAHVAERSWEDDDDIEDDGLDTEMCSDIAEQLILEETGKKMKVIMGGGRRSFRPEEYTSDQEGCEMKREDGKDLIQTWMDTHNEDAKGAYIWNRTELLDLDVENTDYLLGLFDCSHFSYQVDQDTSNPSLEEMTVKAIEMLQKDPNGFFLFVEGGLIDNGHHLNQPRSAIAETLEFEKAVAAANEMTSADDTLILVTADHSHTMQINGYTARNQDILGLADTESDEDGMKYTILMYTNGPGFRHQDHGERPDTADEDWEDVHYTDASTVPRGSAAHSGEDVVLFARGPQSHLFTGIHENSYIPAVFRYAACVGRGKHFCD